MPLINGMKMACEPCIRGHRSTKCTHANERLMVPVRKPGRPLSACPHPRDQTCGCGTQSVTAAIPRKQACHCGSNTPAHGAGPPKSSKSASAIENLPSPTKSTFKIQKPSQHRPGSSRKQSFDPINFQRIDLNQVNIRQPNTPVSLPNGYGTPAAQVYSLPQQYANMYLQYSNVHMEPSPHRQSIDETIANSDRYAGMVSSGGLEHVIESPLTTPTMVTNGNKTHGGHGFQETPLSQYIVAMDSKVNGGSCCVPQEVEKAEYIDGSSLTNHGLPTINGNGPTKATTNRGSCCTPRTSANGESAPFTKGVEEHGLPETNGASAAKPVSNGRSCCAPKKSHSQSSSSSSISEPPEVQLPSCCGGGTSPILKQGPTSVAGTPQIPHQMLPQDGMPYNPQYFPSYQQPTVFTYPATYGSFQNPLQANLWRQNFREGNYAQMPIGSQGQLPFDAPLMPETLNTVHTCSCGDGCQCVGCATHPYNDATQDYVRSAWESMHIDNNGSGEQYANGHINGNGNSITMQPSNGEPLASPTAHTPSASSTASANGDEQSLSANDFFFVNYNFPSDGCGGDTYSCPCGDDCQCIGCEIHKVGQSSLSLPA